MADCQRLEPRLLLSTLQISQEAQLLVYDLNRARNDPAGFAQEQNLNVDLSFVRPRPPLAINAELSVAAERHALEMGNHDDYSEWSEYLRQQANGADREPGYDLPADWAEDLTYVEATAAGLTLEEAEDVLRLLVEDAGTPNLTHRNQLLAIDPSFAEHREIGVGHAYVRCAEFGNYWSVNTASRAGGGPLLTGVVYEDADGNGRYDWGEGLAGVSVTTDHATTVTNSAGGWAMEMPPGEHPIVASGGDFDGTAWTSVTVGADNIEVDFVSGRQWAIVDFRPDEPHTGDGEDYGYDVNGDQHVTPLDALIVVNALNRQSAGVDPYLRSGPAQIDPDVNRDGLLSPVDALLVVGYLNGAPHGDAGGDGDGNGDEEEEEDGDWITDPFPFRPEGEPPSGLPMSSNCWALNICLYWDDGHWRESCDREYWPYGPTLTPVEWLFDTLRGRWCRRTHDQSNVAFDSDGNKVVVVSRQRPGSDSWDVIAQRFSPDGTPLTGEIVIHTSEVDQPSDIGVAIRAEGDYAITWRQVHFENQYCSRNEFFGKVYAAPQTPQQTTFQVTKAKLSQSSRYPQYYATVVGSGPRGGGEYNGTGSAAVDSVFVDGIVLSGTCEDRETGRSVPVSMSAFDRLSDVSPSLGVQYSPACFDGQTDLLHTLLSVRNKGRYALDKPLLVAVANISDASVSVRGAAGFAPDGLPYYNLSDLVPGEELAPGAITESVDLTFYNPLGVPFTYDLVFLARLNEPPAFTSTPSTEAHVGRTYRYDIQSDDPDGQTVRYTIVVGPESMSVDAVAGQITWTPTQNDLGDHAVVIRSDDGNGGVSEQRFSLHVTQPPPNRPPVLTSTPRAEAAATVAYTYDVTVTDPDDDPIALALTAGPDGMTLDPHSGRVSWTPTPDDVGSHEVTIRATDGSGGSDFQTYQLQVHGEPGNHGPVFVSDPPTEFTLPPPQNPSQGDVFPDTLQVVVEPDQIVSRTVSLVLPPDQPALSSADIVFLVDESSSMGTEQAWIRDVITVLDATLESEGITGNRYGLVGFDITPRILKSGDDPFMTTAEFAQATELLSTNGLGKEDGYSAIDYTLTMYAFRPGAASSIILVTDEERATVNSYLTYERVAQRLEARHVALNVVVNGYLADAGDATAFAVDSEGDAYVAAGSAEYQVTGGGHFTGSEPIQGGDTANIKEEYVDLAWQLGGYSFDLNQLRQGGLSAELFSLVFADGITTDVQSRLAITVEASDPSAAMQNVTGTLRGVTAGETATFEVEFGGSAGSGSYELLFVRPEMGDVLGSIPVAVNLGYIYDGQAVDPDGDALTYRLLDGPPGMIIDPPSGLLRWLPAAAPSGPVPVTISVEDGRGGSDKQTFSIAVTGHTGGGQIHGTVFHDTDESGTRDESSEPGVEGRVVYVDRNHNRTRDPGERFAVTGADGSYAITGLPAGTYSVRIQPQPSWSATAPAGGAFLVTVAAGETLADIDFGSFRNGTPINADPKFTSGPPPTAAIAGRLYRYDAVAADPDNDIPAFDLPLAPDGMTVHPQRGILAWQPTSHDVGVHQVVLRVLDGRGGVDLQSFLITVAAPDTPPADALNLPPAILSTPPTLAAVDTPFAYAVKATDPNGDPLSYRLTAQPDGMTIDHLTGQIRWTPAAEQSGAGNTAQIVVEDGRGGMDTQTFDIHVGTEAPNRPPAISSEPAYAAVVAQRYQHQVTASDPDGDTVSFQLTRAPAGMTIDPASGLIDWPSPIEGAYPVTVVADDPAGAQSVQSFVLVAAVNQPPIITSPPPTSVTAGKTYRYDVYAEDPDGDALRYAIDTGPPGMTVDRWGRVRWEPTEADAGTAHAVTLAVRDIYGEPANQSFTLQILADTQPPDIVTAVSSNLVDLGGQIQVQLRATDNVGVEDILLTVGGEAVPISFQNGIGVSILAMDRPGLFDIVATATDAAGNTARSDPWQVRVLDPNDTELPAVEIHSPVMEQQVTYLTEIVATVEDPLLEWWRVEMARADAVDLNYFAADDPDYRLLAGGTTSVTEAKLAAFDPTLLSSDSYVIRVIARDTNGNVNSRGVIVDVSGSAKLGNFRLEFTDLQIPLAGIPIEINRIYDTLEAGQQGDFGYGWQLGVANSRIRETVPVSEAEAAGAFSLFAAHPFRRGTRVYITAPDGRRLGFTFDPGDPEGGFFGTIWHPRFVADPGVYVKLEVEDVPLYQFDDGTFGTYVTRFPYNPNEYTLITKDQVRYRYDQTDGLQDITDPTGSTLTYTDEGIFHGTTGQSIRWTRDDHNRITQITDPAGGTILYKYDQAGDLVSVTNQTGDTTTFSYLSEPAHYFDNYICPLCQPLTRVEYDEDGRVAGIFDALGNAISQSFDVENNTEVVSDRLGNETVLVFDDRGNILSETDPLGHTTRYAYDASDNVISVTDSRGNETTFTYDTAGNATSFTNADGNTWNAVYDPFSQITAATDPLGRTTTYRYDAAGDMIDMVNAAGEYSSLGRDAQGRVASITDARGNTVAAFTYGAAGLPVTATAAGGALRQFEYNAFGLATRYTDEAGGQMTFQYDATGKVLAMTDVAGGVTEFEYDAARVTSVTDSLGRATSFEYDEANRPLRQIDPLQGVTEYEFDANNNITAVTDALGQTATTEYDELGRVRSTADAGGHITQYEYDAAGNLTALTDPLGRTTRLEYDSLDRVVRIIDPEQGQTAYSYDALGNLLSSTDSLGRTTSYAYDRLNRLLHIIDPVGGIVSFEYDAEGNVVSQTDRNGHVVTYEYDDRNRLVRGSDPTDQSIQYTYDEAGRLVSATDPLGNATVYTYDTAGQLLLLTDPLGGTYAWTYDLAGNVLTETDPLDRTTEYAYDDLDRLISATDPAGGQTSYAYDAVGNLTDLIDPVGNRWTFAYDTLDRLIRETDPLGHAKTFAYDPIGNLVSQTDRNGRLTTFVYDGLDRLIEEQWWDGGQVVNSLTYTYDLVGNLVSASDAYSHYTYTHDPLNRILSVDNTGTPNLPRVVLDYTYDAVGNVLSVADSLGVEVASTYDSRNLLTSRIWQGPGIDPARLDFTYNALGQQAEIRRSADATGTQSAGRSVYDYDAKGRLNDLTHLNPADAVLADYDYIRDLADQLIQEIHHGQTSEYTHDLTGQLIAADHSLQDDEFYTYDAAGNREGAGIITGPANRLLSDGTYDYTYDNEGNLVRKTEIATGNVTAYTYDHRNRLIAVQERSPGGILLTEVTYTYDIFDRRITRTADADGGGPQPAETTHHIYDRAHTWADFNSQGAILARYLYGDQIDQILARYRPDSGTAWYLTDHLGTVRDITDATGQVINHLTYSTFGLLQSQTNPTLGDRFTYTARELDYLTGLYNYRLRHYDPTTARFTTQDPLTFTAGDPNLYRYVANSPLTYTDPWGLAAATEYGTDLSRLGRRLAGAAMGYAVGYACGYLEAWYLGSPTPHQDALVEAAVGAAIGGIIGPAVARLPGKYQLWAGIAMVVYSAATSEDFVVFGIRSTCIAVEFGVGGGFRNVKDIDVKGFGRSIKRFMADESGALRLPRRLRSSSRQRSRRFRGGSHRDMSGPRTKGDFLDSHHMPDRGADPVRHQNDGPSIQMDPPDHHATSSNGRQGASGARYRAETARLIREGRYRDAMAREIRDVRRAALEVSGDLRKYNEAILEMLEYALQSGQLPWGN